MGKFNNVIDFDWIEKLNRWILVPSCGKSGRYRRIKYLDRIKNSSCFAYEIQKTLLLFIYRAVIQLKLQNRKIIFMRAVVKNKYGMNTINYGEVHELDWDVGTLVVLPRSLRLKDIIKLTVDTKQYEICRLELLVIHCLLQIAFPDKPAKWYANMAAQIIALGFKELDANILRNIKEIK